MERPVFDISTFVDVLTPEMATAKLTERFVKRRKEKGLSRRRIADISGVSYASVRRFEETGEISLHSLLKLAQALGCVGDFDELFSHPILTDLKDLKV